MYSKLHIFKLYDLLILAYPWFGLTLSCGYLFLFVPFVLCFLFPLLSFELSIFYDSTLYHVLVY